MPAPSIQELFGVNASLSGSTLAITLTDFLPEGFDVTDPTASRVVAAMVKRWKNFTTGKEDDPTVGITVGAPFVSLATRGEQTQRSFQYSVSLYIPDVGAAEPDPDLVV
ncbi:MAG: hypothetical protein VKJ46_15965 [Leptolyngbyaceae bacterium]|nr:hypothetical protein [Leptolyngbyaceae bacterium]